MQARFQCMLWDFCVEFIGLIVVSYFFLMFKAGLKTKIDKLLAARKSLNIDDVFNLFCFCNEDDELDFGFKTIKKT